MNHRIYLDYNATTPLAPEVVEAMRPLLSQAYGNPSSLHWAGLPAREVVEQARSQVAGLLGCDVGELVFTSGGSEANNHAIKGVYFHKASKLRKPHVITTRIEHPAVVQPCRFLERLGAQVTWLPVDRYGLVDPDDVRRAIRPETILISVMHANNEVGSIQPIEQIAQIARHHNVLCHSDAAQSVGKIEVDVETLGVDLLSVAGHKLYAPKGVGALYVRRGTQLEPLMHGAGHETGRRAGTENTLAIAGLGVACQLASRRGVASRLQLLRDYFWEKLEALMGERVVLNGHPDRRLPNTLNVSLLGHDGADILSQLSGVAASTGSACHSGRTHISPTLQAMEVSDERGRGAIRFSLGHPSTQDEVDEVLDQLAHIEGLVC